jgi:hypothetical protein
MIDLPEHMQPWPAEIWARAGEELDAKLGWMLLAAALVAIVGLGLRALTRRQPAAADWTGRVLVAALIGFGAWRAFDEACLLDDAYITFRYVENFLDGHGLVWNIGERVEGYTNFLWAILVAAVAWVTGAFIPSVGFHLASLTYLANLVVIALIGFRLAPRGYGWLGAIAGLGLSVGQMVFTNFGTTGLETAAASLLVDLGLLFLVKSDTRRDAGLAGLFLILGTLTRPDHALFYATGSFVLVVAHGPAIVAALKGKANVLEAGLDRWLAYAAPFLLYLAHLGWRLSYYGDKFPNTYYAKSADLTYWAAGSIYARTFYLSSHAWVLALALLGWALLVKADCDGQRRLKLFAVVGVAIYNVYVMRVGGDFMFGRFYVTLIPLMALGAGALLVTLLARAERASQLVGAGALALVLGGTVVNFNIVHETWNKWYQADETWLYGLTSVYPIEERHSAARAGKAFRVLYDAGVRPTISSSGIGMVGFYSKLELIDAYGLTDTWIARQKIKERRRPGHEKRVPNDYLRKRGVAIKRGGWSSYGHLTKLRLPLRGGEWNLFRYDPELMATIAELTPRFRFFDFVAHLDREALRLSRLRDEAGGELSRKDHKQLTRDLHFYRDFYFDHVDDPGRLAQLEALLEPKTPAPPPPEAPATDGEVPRDQAPASGSLPPP